MDSFISYGIIYSMVHLFYTGWGYYLDDVIFPHNKTASIIASFFIGHALCIGLICFQVCQSFSISNAPYIYQPRPFIGHALCIGLICFQVCQSFLISHAPYIHIPLIRHALCIGLICFQVCQSFLISHAPFMHQPHPLHWTSSVQWPDMLLGLSIIPNKPICSSSLAVGTQDMLQILVPRGMLILRVCSALSQRINHSTWNSNLNLYSTWNSNSSLVFNLKFQF